MCASGNTVTSGSDGHNMTGLTVRLLSCWVLVAGLFWSCLIGLNWQINQPILFALPPCTMLKLHSAVDCEVKSDNVVVFILLNIILYPYLSVMKGKSNLNCKAIKKQVILIFYGNRNQFWLYLSTRFFFL